MAEQSFWDMLRAKRDSLTKSGIIVADYLMQHAEDAQYLSISSLAKACGVAEATIFRFCRALGFDGYNEMKIALAKATATAMPVKLAVLFVANVLVLRYTLDNQELANLSLSRTSRALGSKLL